jgi:hypothetical protein
VEEERMKRTLLPFVAIGAVLLAAVALFLMMRARAPAPSPAAQLPEIEAVDPLRKEMACVDRVLQNRNMRSDEVEPALARCRAGAGGGAAGAGNMQ